MRALMRAVPLIIYFVSGVTAKAVAEMADPRALAAEILETTGIKAGLCVHLGVTDGRLTAELSAGGRFLVHGLAADRAAVERARKHIQSRALYGRVSVERSSFKRLPYADNLVNLVVAENGGAGLSLKEVARVLVPDGVACFGGRVEAAKLAAAGFENVKTSGGWTVAVKPRPKEMDDWTHWNHGPDGNKVAKDALVGPPERLRWMVGPTWGRHHDWKGLQPAAMVSADGRVFYVFDEAPVSVAGPARPFLVARDAYNGLLLWKRPVEVGYGRERTFKQRTLVAAGDRVYTTLEAGAGPLVALDAATGRTVMEYKHGAPEEVLHCEGTLIVASKREIRSIHAASGRMRWKRGWGAENVLIGDGSIYCQRGREIIGLELATGRERWRKSISSLKSPTLCFYQSGFLVLDQGNTSEKGVHVLSARDGRHLWSKEYETHANRLGEQRWLGGLIWVHVAEGPKEKRRLASLGLEPATGAVKKRVDFTKEFVQALGTGHHRCYRNRATERYFLLGKNCIEFIDWRTGKLYATRVARGSCHFGVLPANGLVYAPPHHCVCNNRRQFRGFLALAPAAPSSPKGAAAAGGAGLETGPAFGAGGGSPGAPRDDWPTYRQGPRRRGSTPTAIPTPLVKLWETELGGRLTAPTVAGGTVFVASVDEHRVVAVDAAGGKPRWSFTAGGRVDTPPTIHGRLCLFGSADGSVYCLRARDGKLAWRLRAAPLERRIVADEQLESAWPVHGSVLVRDGVVYFAAGRSAELDGGIYACAVQPRTGKVLWRRQPNSPALNDVMIGGDDFVYMRGYTRFDPKTGEQVRRSGGARLRVRAGLLESSWPSRTYWRYRSVEGELLVVGKGGVYGVRAFAGKRRKSASTQPGKGEYVLFSGVDRKRSVWSSRVPLRIGLVLAGDKLFAAGIPDAVDEKDYWTAFDGEKGGELWAFSAADGKKLSQLKLDCPPVFDGMAAAGGRLFISCRDGKLRCFGKK